MNPASQIKIGTCAWSYEDWRGVFYPEHLPATERLAFYARHLPGVEIDSTFYAIPAAKVVAHWAEITPPDFAFTCKLPREITHERKLRDSAGAVHEFLEALTPLSSKLWAILIQLPPFFEPARDETALRHFIRELPSTARFAVEFRHPDWHHPRIAHLLADHGVTWAWNDITTLEHQAEAAFEFLPDTTDFLYVRLMGDLERKYDPATGHRIHQYRHLMWPRDGALENWAARIQQAAADHPRIFAAVANHFEGFAPHTARRLGHLLHLDFLEPDLTPHSTKPEDPQLDLL